MCVYLYKLACILIKSYQSNKDAGQLDDVGVGNREETTSQCVEHHNNRWRHHRPDIAQSNYHCQAGSCGERKAISTKVYNERDIRVHQMI